MGLDFPSMPCRQPFKPHSGLGCDRNLSVITQQIAISDSVTIARFRHLGLAFEAFAEFQTADSHGWTALRKKARPDPHRLPQERFAFARTAGQCERVTKRMQCVEQVFLARCGARLNQATVQFRYGMREISRECL